MDNDSSSSIKISKFPDGKLKSKLQWPKEHSTPSSSANPSIESVNSRKGVGKIRKKERKEWSNVEL